jgi:hypothetical protein
LGGAEAGSEEAGSEGAAGGAAAPCPRTPAKAAALERVATFAFDAYGCNSSDSGWRASDGEGGGPTPAAAAGPRPPGVLLPWDTCE